MTQFLPQINCIKKKEIEIIYKTKSQINQLQYIDLICILIWTINLERKKNERNYHLNSIVEKTYRIAVMLKIAPPF